ncbi:MAG TPA: ABC transporter ATP-binding protein [Thermoanaerobaculia bacterium]|nr:ABC transporter ATP-binding protein [Thermoanaerobaculia bacterium]
MPSASPTSAATPAPQALSEPGAPEARDAPASPGARSAPACPASVVELDQLSVRFGRRPILHQLTAKLGGRCIGLLGPNGAGKTTLLHTLLGFHPPASGTARIFGLDICGGRSEARAIRALMGYMPETDSFVTGMSGVRFVRLMAELSGLPAEQAMERAHEALFYVGLGEARYRPIESYSLGMKQLAKLAQSLVHGPRLLLLDEPTNGLDPPARQRMLELIRDIRDDGEVHVILSSHLLRDVEECCEEVLVLKGGQVAVYANLEEERRANRRFLDLEVRGARGADGSAAFAAAAAALGCECAAGTRQRLKLVLPEGVEVRDLYRLAAERQLQIRRLDFKRDSLEDIFLKAMEGGNHGGV